jgi:predicted 2-oxoglutarate/Fe(II)-dependent dioxygenase YbiX
MNKVAQATARHLRRSKIPWIRAMVLEAKKSDLMVSIFKKGQRRNKKASRTEGIIRLLLIILWAIVVVALGLYGGLATSHHR